MSLSRPSPLVRRALDLAASAVGIIEEGKRDPRDVLAVLQALLLFKEDRLGIVITDRRKMELYFKDPKKYPHLLVNRKAFRRELRRKGEELLMQELRLELHHIPGVRLHGLGHTLRETVSRSKKDNRGMGRKSALYLLGALLSRGLYPGMPAEEIEMIFGKQPS